MTDTPIVKAFTIRITSGEFAGRYVGPRFGGGLVTNPEESAGQSTRGEFRIMGAGAGRYPIF